MVVNLFKNIFLILISYVLICFLIYIISGFLLVNGITPKIKLITEYQKFRCGFIYLKTMFININYISLRNVLLHISLFDDFLIY